MLKLRFICGVLAAVLLVAASALAANPTGKWVGSAEPNDGPNQFTLVLSKVSSGYTGTIEDEVGKIAAKTPIEEVKWDGTRLTFSFPLADGATVVKVKAGLEGDKMTGSFMVSDGEAGTFVFERRK
jgi:hypothetical protein